MDYRIGAIFKRTLQEFKEADDAANTFEKEYKKAPNTVALLARVFSLKERRTEAGVMLIMTAGALLEHAINDYAYTFLDAEWYEEHLGNLRGVTKWILLPRLCQNKNVSEDDPVINDLREFVKARNAIVHQKRRDFDRGVAKAVDHTSSESARFLSACRKVDSTVYGLLNVLSSPPSMK